MKTVLHKFLLAPLTQTLKLALIQAIADGMLKVVALNRIATISRTCWAAMANVDLARIYLICRMYAFTSQTLCSHLFGILIIQILKAVTV